MSSKFLSGNGCRLIVAAILTAMLMFSVSPQSAHANAGAGSSLPSTSGPQIDPAEAYREGVEALQAGDYKTAEKKFNDVLTVARKMPEANYYMGVTKVRLGKEKSSVRYFKRAVKERPEFVEAREQLALVQINNGKPDDAAEQLEALKKIAADCTPEECDEAYTARTARAIENVETALNGEAGEDVSFNLPNNLEDRFALAPRDNGVSLYVRAARLINQERYEEAIEDLYASQRIVGPHPDILNYLGYAHRKQGYFDKAQSYYKTALRIAPDHLGANEYLGELYLEIGDIRKAKKQLAKLDSLCDFGCAEREDLARLIETKLSDRRAAR